MIDVEVPNCNRALQGAYRKGAIAAKAGEPRSSCPYEDKRKPSGLLSWSRSFINAWHDGYDAQKRALDTIDRLT